jgi:uncharacterized membrane protein
MKLLIAIIVLFFISCNSTKKISHKEEIKTTVIDKTVKDSVSVKIIDSVVFVKVVDTSNELNFDFGESIPLWVLRGQLVDSGKGVKINVPKGTKVSVIKNNIVHEAKTTLFKSDSAAIHQDNNIVTKTEEVVKDTDKKASRFAWTTILMGICAIVLIAIGYYIYKQVKV